MLRNPTRTILIVEPDEDSRSALRDTLERDGYTVVCTAGAADALLAVESRGINLVITELYLADGGGDRCLVRAIRQSAALKRTRVLAYTRHGRGEDRTWAIEQGANGYVLKKNGEARLLEVADRLSRPPTRSKRRMTRPPNAQ